MFSIPELVSERTYIMYLTALLAIKGELTGKYVVSKPVVMSTLNFWLLLY